MEGQHESRAVEARFDDVALIFEGGAMRNAYTAAMVAILVQERIVFPKAYGISAGAALALFYASRDPQRARATFTESVQLKRAGGLAGLVKGEGFFDLPYLFEGLAETHALDDDEWSIDFAQLKEGPTDIHIEAFDLDSGTTAAWTRADMRTLTDAMRRVEASCSYPLFTPATEIDGHRYIDGGVGSSHGICLDAALRDGFRRFLVVRTQERDYRMPPLSALKRDAYAVAYAKHPKALAALEGRPDEYNLLLDRLEDLRQMGSAYVFCPETMPITYKTTDYAMLCEAYERGLSQCDRELPRLRAWLAGC